MFAVGEHECLFIEPIYRKDAVAQGKIKHV